MATTPRFRRALHRAALCGLALLLFAGQVLALGLGRIEVKSRTGEPLLAEIQVVSSNPAELDQLRARLASPETFRRIGLDAPDAVVSGLEFTVALDVRGNPVIRVTTREPVTQPALTFLVEVDWGQGRLVREYSALVDTPQTVAAPAQPAIAAPEVASNTIVRPATSAVGEEAPDPAIAAAPAEGGDATPEPTPVATPRPAPVSAPAPPASAVDVAPPAGEYTVQAGDTLGAIAAGLVGEGVSREQAIVALFRANPQAFIAGNLNLIRQGAVLRVPGRDELAALDRREARALMREQIAAWREMTQPAPPPDAAVADAAAGGEGQAEAPATGGQPAARTADARLEIVPPSAGDGQQAGTRSGIQAGGEGEMLRQEMQQALLENQETLAAREAEVAELKARVADLERLQAQQAQLISMKDSELAAAQERLAGTTAAATTPPDADAAGAAASGLPWAWIGLGLLLVAAVAWWLLRRAPKATPRPRFDAATLEAAAPPRTDAAAPAPVQAPAPPAPRVPAWHAGGAATPAAGTGDEVVPAGGPRDDVAAATREPTTPSVAPQDEVVAPVSTRSDADVIAALNPAPGGPERIELARAYLDLGDTDTARDLLREVVQAGDADARAEAARLLDGIA